MNDPSRFKFCPAKAQKLVPVENSKKNDSKEERVDREYFGFYKTLDIHNSMLRDHQRVEFYHRAISDNAELFRDKVVLDVGSGLGILSIFAAQNGAKKVYAIEACQELAKYAEKAFEVNEVNHIVELKVGKVETIEIEENIDIIVSEWMGYCLLFEQMLPSVIFARDKFQADLMLPNRANLYICGLNDEAIYKCCIGSVLPEVEGNEGLDLSSLVDKVTKRVLTIPIGSESIATTSALVGKVDLETVTLEESRGFKTCQFELRMKKMSVRNLHGLVLYFEVHFTRGTQGRCTLTNSPFSEPTHWLQSLCLFKTPYEINDNDGLIKGQFQLTPSSLIGRGIKVSIDLDGDQHFNFIKH